MKNPNNTTRHDSIHTKYGGIIEANDFSTCKPNKKRIHNQMEALHFDQTLQREKEGNAKYSQLTLEELREMQLISNTDGRPSNNLTDTKWQEEFEIRKLFVVPYRDGHRKRLTGVQTKESRQWNQETQSRYYGCTNWQSYCTYINDVLKNIRAGQIDYCYFIYQILDLLKFHYADLRTRYCDGYWEVWLAKK